MDDAGEFLYNREYSDRITQELFGELNLLNNRIAKGVINGDYNEFMLLHVKRDALQKIVSLGLKNN